MPAETLYDGPAQHVTFNVPSAGIVRFGFKDPRASGYVRSRDESLARVQPGTQLFLSAGQHVLTLYDPKLVAVVTIVFEPRRTPTLRSDQEQGGRQKLDATVPNTLVKFVPIVLAAA